MYPTRLNLLPPDKRSVIQRMIYVQYVKNIFEVLVIVLCLSGTVLLGGEWTLQSHFNSFVATLSTISNQQTEKNKVIKEANAVFASVESLQKKYQLWTPIIGEITQAVPDRVLLTGLTLDEKENVYGIDGMASTRDDLLLFQRRLQAVKRIKSVIVPVGQLTEKDNIQFSITAEVQ